MDAARLCRLDIAKQTHHARTASESVKVQRAVKPNDAAGNVVGQRQAAMFAKVALDDRPGGIGGLRPNLSAKRFFSLFVVVRSCVDY